jgi:hypothetical protein
MGMTISYRGKLKSPDLIDTMSKELSKIANLMEWDYTILDEGKYWETVDEDLLKEKMEFLSQKMDAVSQALENSWIELEPGDSDLDIIVKIEKILREIE